jgi:Tfp pilus assembly PilM family ATPase
LNMTPFSQPSLIGLDVQPGSVQLVKLKKTKHSFLLEQIVTASLPSDVFVEGKIRRWEVLCSLLSEIVQVQGMRGLAAAITLPVNLVRMQSIILPSGLSDVAIEAEIYARVERDLPGMTEALCIDFTESQQKNTGYSTVFFTAVRQAYLSHYVECVNASGLKVKIADVDIYSLSRAICFALQFQPKSSEIIAIVHLGLGIATLLFFNGHDIMFHQHWDIVDVDAIRFSAQFKRNIELFQATVRHSDIQQLAVCGDPEMIATMTRYLAQAGTFQLSYPDLFARIKIASHLDTDILATPWFRFLIACGAAMREVPKW